MICGCLAGPGDPGDADIACALRARVDLPSRTRFRLVGAGLAGFSEEDARPMRDLFGGDAIA